MSEPDALPQAIQAQRDVDAARPRRERMRVVLVLELAPDWREHVLDLARHGTPQERVAGEIARRMGNAQWSIVEAFVGRTR